MKKLPTDKVIKTFYIPQDLVSLVDSFMSEHGIQEAGIPWREAIGIKEEEIPLACLRGARYREDLTQQQVSDLTGIPKRHISEMENGKRPIGKKNALKLAAALNIDVNSLLKV